MSVCSTFEQVASQKVPIFTNTNTNYGCNPLKSVQIHLKPILL